MRTIGLLHDTGRLVLAANLPEGFERVCQMAAENAMPHWEAERDEFGTTHAEVGAYLFGLWGLPESIVEAVAYHHSPSTCPHPGTATLTALHVADILSSDVGTNELDSHGAQPDLQYLAMMGVSGRLPEWRDVARQMAADEAPRA